MRKSSLLVGLFGVGVAAATTQAHHAVQAQFDVNRQESFTGVLTKVDWINPHAWFHFDVKKADGTVEQWATETIGPNGLRRLGLSDRRLFVVGDIIKGFGALVARHKGEVSAEVTVAEPLSEAHLAEVKDALRAAGHPVRSTVRTAPEAAVPEAAVPEAAVAAAPVPETAAAIQATDDDRVRDR